MEQNLPSVAVVILNWNGQKLLEEFLPSVTATSYSNSTIYLADNGSSDDSISFVANNFPSVQIIALPENYGFAEGYNQALQRIFDENKAQYYVLLNSDVAVDPDWLDHLVETAEKDSSIGALQPKVRSFKQPSHFEYAGAGGGFWDKWGYPFCRGRILHIIEEDKGQYDEPCEVAWASGCALFIKADLYHQIGGLDADFFAHFEEIDLCWRVWRSGHRIKVVPSSVIYHVGGATLQESPRKTFLNFRNSLVFLLKNKPMPSVMTAIISRLFMDGIAGFVFVLKGQPKNMLAIVKAHWSFFLRFPFWLKKRREVKKRLSDFKPLDPPEYTRSIVWQFYGKKVRKYSDL